MSVQEAIQQSNYASAELAVGDRVTVIDGTENPWALKRGVDGMPPHQIIERDELEDIVTLLDEDERASLLWVPIQEAEA